MINTLNLNDFTLLEEIGSGSFGDVYKVKENKTGNILAAKISKEALADKSIQDVREFNRETGILSKVNHPAILKFIGISSVDFSGNPFPVIITEFISNGTLLDIIELERNSLSDFKWTDTQKLINIYGIAKAMSFLHSHNIIHRDLKPANILMDEFLCPKIADFGLSKRIHYNAESIAASQSTLQVKGTPIYIAPESWIDMIYSPASDVYAFGMIIYEIITGLEPYTELPFAIIMLNVTRGKRPPIDEIVPPSYKNLIERCWSQEASKRPTFEQIVNELKTNEGFITDLVEVADYQNYINYIDQCPANFDSPEPLIKIDEYIGHETQTFKRIKINELLMMSKNSSNKHSTKNTFNFFPPKILKSLSEECKQLIEEAKTDPNKQLEIGEFLVEGKGKFPQNTELGMKFLDLSSKSGNSEATVYYSRLLVEGEFVPPDLEKAKMILSRCTEQSSSSFIFLRGKIAKKEKDYALAMENFVAASKLGNAEAMYECGKMLTKGRGCQKDEKEAKKYFKMATKNGYSKSDSEFEKKPLMTKKYDTENIKERSSIPQDDSNVVSDKLEKSDTNEIVEYAVKLYENQDDKELRREAVKYFRMAAEKGNAKALNYLGTILFEGQEGIEKEDKREAAICYKKSAELGFPAAMCNYGFCLQNGEGVEKADRKEAVHFFKQAADGGDDVAMCLLGFCLENGDGVEKDAREAAKYFKMAAEKGNEVAIRVYEMYQENINEVNSNTSESVKYNVNTANRGVREEALQQNQNNGPIKMKQVQTYTLKFPNNRKTPASSNQLVIPINSPSPQRASQNAANSNQGVIQQLYPASSPSSDAKGQAVLYKVAADSGSPASMNSYGICLRDGIGVEKNAIEAARYFKMAADKGNPNAKANYAYCLLKGEGVKRSRGHASICYKEAAELGDADGMVGYGKCLLDGEIFVRNESEAARLFKNAADQGNVDGMANYGRCLEKGEGVEINLSEACKFYKMAADRGDVDMMVKYGECLLYYSYSTYSINEASYYFKMAADKGSLSGAANYGHCLLNGMGVPMNKNEGIRLIKEAADKGNPTGLEFYGLCLLNGDGVPMNKEEGVRYIKKAADTRNPKSMVTYGIVLLNGLGVEVNHEEALKYIRSACYEDDSNGILQLGLCMLKGQGVKQDRKQGEKLIKMAADMKNLDAMFEYAQILLTANKNENIPVAAKLLYEAAGRGHAKSIYSLQMNNRLQYYK